MVSEVQDPSIISTSFQHHIFNIITISLCIWHGFIIIKIISHALKAFWSAAAITTALLLTPVPLQIKWLKRELELSKGKEEALQEQLTTNVSPFRDWLLINTNSSMKVKLYQKFHTKSPQTIKWPLNTLGAHGVSVPAIYRQSVLTSRAEQCRKWEEG